MAASRNDAELNGLAEALSRTPVYRVLLLANLIGQPFFSRFGKRYTMTLSEWRIMLVLAASPGISISGVCEKSGLHIMNVSRGVKGLERRGRVLRTRDPSDRRLTILQLSADGAAVFRTIAPHGLAWADTVFEVLSDEEIKSFDRMLNKMIDHARSHGGEN